MKTPRTESVVRMAVGPMREYAIIDHAQNLERENIAMRLALEDEGHAHELWSLAQLRPGEGIDDGVNRIHAFLSALANAKCSHGGTPLADTTGSPCVDLGGGYTAVPFEAVTLNGMFLPQLIASARGKSVAVIGPDNRALQGESGRTYRYTSIEEARADVEVLRRINGENSKINEPGSPNRSTAPA